MKNYVLGFAFNEYGDYLALIEKQRPTWQKGRWNGIGGHVEPTDRAFESAMSREFHEETGVLIAEDCWKHFGMLDGNNWQCALYTCKEIEVNLVETKTDERVDVFYYRQLPHVIDNLLWLIPAARNVWMTDENRVHLHAKYSK